MRSRCVSRILLVGHLLLPLAVHAAAPTPGDTAPELQPVSQERLLTGTAESRDWLMYGGNYDNTRFSPLTDINRQNVKKLSPAWSSRPGFRTSFRPLPLSPTG